ncbi:MAG TPA: metal-sulfur cluster assembly factor [Acidisarcina sp.]|nr:metal-sulfur cluster assembly factor [Acidisarcina sp.]
MALTEQDVLTALKDCYDPEVPVNIVDLGLVYGVTLQPDADSTPAFPRQHVAVEMTLTTPHCPAHSMMVEQIRNRLAGIPEISQAKVNLVWQPAWGPERITPEGRKALGFE